MEFRPGDNVQHYRIVEKIGEGGMGVVWKALDTTLDRTVAVSMDLGAETRPVGEPQTLFRPKLRRDLFAPHPDGSRFLAVLRLDPEIDRAVLVDDWDAPDRAP